MIFARPGRRPGSLTEAISERSNELVGANLDQPPSQLVERLVIADRGLRAAVHGAGVEFDVEIHQTHAGRRITGEDRPLDEERHHASAAEAKK